MSWPDTSREAYRDAAASGWLNRMEGIACEYLYDKSAFLGSDVAVALDMYDRDCAELVKLDLHKVGKMLQRKGVAVVVGHTWWNKTVAPDPVIRSKRCQALQLTGDTGVGVIVPRTLTPLVRQLQADWDSLHDLMKDNEDYPSERVLKVTNGLFNRLRSDIARLAPMPTPDRVFWDPTLPQDVRREIVEGMTEAFRNRLGYDLDDDRFDDV